VVALGMSANLWSIAADPKDGSNATQITEVELAKDQPAEQGPPRDPEDSLVFEGRVLDPDGQPFAGAKLYLKIKDSSKTEPRLKDPNAKVWEAAETRDQKWLKAAHPKLIATLTRLGLDPNHVTPEE